MRLNTKPINEIKMNFSFSTQRFFIENLQKKLGFMVYEIINRVKKRNIIIEGDMTSSKVANSKVILL